MDIQKVIMEYSRFCDRYRNDGILAYSFSLTGLSEYTGIHMDVQKFAERFSRYEIEEVKSKQYPYKLHIMINGVKFYALASEGEFAELEQRKCSS